MNPEFYIIYENKVKGPFPLVQVQHFVKTNQITRQTLVLLRGQTVWKMAGCISELYPPAPVVVPVQKEEAKREAKNASPKPKQGRKKAKKAASSAAAVDTSIFDFEKPKRSAKKASAKKDTGISLFDSDSGSSSGPSSDFTSGSANDADRDSDRSEDSSAFSGFDSFESSDDDDDDRSSSGSGSSYRQRSNNSSDSNSQLLLVVVILLVVVVGLVCYRRMQAMYAVGKINRLLKAETARMEKEALEDVEQEDAELENVELGVVGRGKVDMKTRNEFHKKYNEQYKKASEFCNEIISAKKKRGKVSQSVAQSKVRARGTVAGERMIRVVNGVEFAFRWCPAGKFTMGSPEKEKGHRDNETQQKVSIDEGFWMLETEVTIEMIHCIMPSLGLIDTSLSKTAVDATKDTYGKQIAQDVKKAFELQKVILGEMPIQVSMLKSGGWDTMQEFCKKLGNKLNMEISIPTEEQWEYACRAGTSGPYAGNLDSIAWYNLNAGKDIDSEAIVSGNRKAWFVGQKKPNSWGLYDMHGGLYEICLEKFEGMKKNSKQNNTERKNPMLDDTDSDEESALYMNIGLGMDGFQMNDEFQDESAEGSQDEFQDEPMESVEGMNGMNMGFSNDEDAEYPEDEEYEPDRENNIPSGQEEFLYHVARGGGLFSPAEHCRSAYRTSAWNAMQEGTLGFRIVAKGK